MKLITENTYPNAEHQVVKEVHKSEENNEQTISIETEDGKPIILIVEDNRDIREYVRSSFEEMYEVLTAADGKEGWDIAQNQIPNIIISDIMMPVMDGIELCRHIKKICVPVIFQSFCLQPKIHFRIRKRDMLQEPIPSSRNRLVPVC